MKERVGDEKLIITGVAVRGINDHIRFYSQLARCVFPVTVGFLSPECAIHSHPLAPRHLLFSRQNHHHHQQQQLARVVVRVSEPHLTCLILHCLEARFLSPSASTGQILRYVHV